MCVYSWDNVREHSDNPQLFIHPTIKFPRDCLRNPKPKRDLQPDREILGVL